MALVLSDPVFRVSRVRRQDKPCAARSERMIISVMRGTSPSIALGVTVSCMAVLVRPYVLALGTKWVRAASALFGPMPHPNDH